MRKTLKQYIESYLKIKTKEGEILPLKFNTAQNRFYDIVRERFNRNEPCKIIVLKARQLGISTATEAVGTGWAMQAKNVNGLIVAHSQDSTSNIFNMTKLYYDELPAALKPMIKNSNMKLLNFENPTLDPREKERNPGLRSNIRVALAGSAGVGRSSTFRFMHLSELAFWEESKGQTVQDQLTGLLQTLPQHGFSLLVIESTANGFNYFKTLWDQAVSGENDFIPLFIPWYEMEEYRKPWKGEEFSEDELKQKAMFHLDNEQLMWRRYAIRNLCGNSVETFHQEYPSTPEEAFIVTGAPIFDTKAVLDQLNHVKSPIRQGIFVSGKLLSAENGPVKIWQDPIPGHVYAIGADTAGDGSDYFVAYCLDQSTQEMVATYRSVTDEDLFVKQYEALGRMYNTAMLGPECNFSTYPTMKLQENGYFNMYVREVEDTYLDRVTKRYGFKTTSVTRPLVIAMLVEYARENMAKIHDPALLREMLSFIKNANGRAEAASGEHDDCIMAFAISLYILPQAISYDEQIATTNIFEEDYTRQSDSWSDFLSFGG